MRPLVDAPQMKNVAVSSQKSRERTPSPSAASATRAGLAPPPAAGSTRSPPNGGMPRSAGRSRRNRATMGIATAAAPAITSVAARQP